jgi:Tol biopolymer transport system component
MIIYTTDKQHLANRSAGGAKGWHSYAIRRMQTSVALALVLALVMLAGGLPPITHAQDAWPLIDGTLTAVNDGPGDQTDPHVSGDVVAYTSSVAGEVEIRYHNLRTGADAGIPNNGGADFNPDISGSTIVYTHLAADHSRSVYMFDTTTAGPPVELDAQSGHLGDQPAIGNQTVVWAAFDGSTDPPELMVYDLDTRTTTRLTDDQAGELNPAVSPDGSVIVWEKCYHFSIDCDIWQATRSGSGWTTAQLTDTAADERDPDTDGRIVVYHSSRGGDGSDIFWQPVGGGVEHDLALADQQQNASVSGNLVVFEHFDMTAPTPSYDILLYDILGDRVYRITQTSVNETFPDIAVAPDGQVHAVWTTREGEDHNVYALTFRRPASDQTPPSITISAPAATTYALNQVVSASYSCADESGGSGLASCVGPVASGSAIDTASVGSKSFSVQASDNAGNTASQSVTYTVAYNVCALYDQSKSHKLGSTVPIKLLLCDASGANVSSSNIVVHATGLTKVDNTASSTLDTTSAANPDNDFRYDATLGGSGGYIYNLSTKNLTMGTWALSFSAAGDPTTHTVRFDVR